VAVKDLFAVAGHPVGAGVPDYLAEQEPSTEHATAVRRLLDAGAAVRGIARTDQFAYSLAGDNEHYGTPVNPVVPGGLPGGSSSGSAVAVSLGTATIGLATDTAGSVRIPASYQGLWGLRTSHGSVPDDGLLALAPSFDAVGLLAREPEVLGRAAAALLADEGGSSLDADLVTCPELAELLTPGVAASLEEWTAGRFVGTVALPDVAEVAESFRVHQAFEAWKVHGAWVSDHPDALRGPVRARFEVARAVTSEEDEAASAALARARARIDEALGDRVLVLASAASSAPRVWDSAEQVDRVRSATMRLTCLAGVTGRPSVSLPVLSDGGDPVGLGLVGPRGSDLALLELARRLQ
jgi:amidase